MSKVQEMLLQRRREVNAAIAALREEVREIDTALAAIDPVRRQAPAASASAQTSPKMTINDAIIEAVKNGCGTPAEISKFLPDQLGIETTKHSISTRLSKMKNDGILTHDAKGQWILKKEETPADDSEGASDSTGEGDASPNEGYDDLKFE